MREGDLCGQFPHGWVKTITVEPLPPQGPSTRWVWHIGAVTDKQSTPTPNGHVGQHGRTVVTMQLTADQQVDLSISGEDAYGNAVPITGDVQWLSSDESIITIDQHDDTHATAVAVGPVGTASVTVTNDADRDGTGDFMGSLAIDVVAGDITEISIDAGEPVDKPA
jgi:hypothetical protein